MTNPTSVIKSIGLPADALAVMVFAEPSGEFYRDMTTSRHLSGFRHLDNFAGTRKLTSVYRDFAKTTPSADTDGN